MFYSWSDKSVKSCSGAESGDYNITRRRTVIELTRLHILDLIRVCGSGDEKHSRSYLCGAITIFVASTRTMQGFAPEMVARRDCGVFRLFEVFLKAKYVCC